MASSTLFFSFTFGELAILRNALWREVERLEEKAKVESNTKEYVWSLYCEKKKLEELHSELNRFG